MNPTTDLLKMVDVPIAEARATGVAILTGMNVATQDAALVIDALIQNELDGYASHGLLRIPDYIDEIKSGTLIPGAMPKVSSCGPNSSVIDGCRGFGVLSAQAVIMELDHLLANQKFAVVGLQNSNHIGRLAPIGLSIAQQGRIVIGFVNFLGAGQKVLPWQGTDGRLCTNPMLFAFPAPGSPVVVDLTTSVVPEGKVRQAFLSGTDVPDGWLVDNLWQCVNDPSRLYTTPPTAFLAPLGAEQGHKGFALALVSEIMAGIVSGAGYANANPLPGGNGGLFIGLSTDVLGRSPDDAQIEIQHLCDYMRNCPPLKPDQKVRIPGDTSKRVRSSHIITSNSFWAKLKRYEQSLGVTERIDREEVNDSTSF